MQVVNAEKCKCGSDTFNVIAGAVTCSLCGEVYGTSLKPVSTSEIGELVMPLGKHKGQKIKDVPQDYLHWAAKNLEKGIGPKIKQYLEEQNEVPF